jgi:hypothetical protein
VTIIYAILLATVLPTILLTHSNMQFALAQSANQTSSAAAASPLSLPVMESKFHSSSDIGS